jgi:polysaccharide export outer membrane protein
MTVLMPGVFVAGCINPFHPAPSHRNHSSIEQINVQLHESVVTDAARLRPGLVITVNVLVSGKKEIEAIGKRVTDKGTIAMPLLGVVGVDGLTLDELGLKLMASYKEYFVNPQVIVEFVRDDNKEGLSPWGSVTVLGRVKKPGKISIPATRDLTLSAAIQQAGGFDTSAKETAIRITHRLANGQLSSREVNLHSVGAQGLVEEDVMLEPDDVVYVPELVF